MAAGGFVKLYRSILTWEWFADRNARDVFLYILLAANYREKVWKGKKVGRGQLYTSYATLAAATSMSYKQARAAVGKLKGTGELHVEQLGNGLLVTVNNYEKFQGGQAEGQDLGNDIRSKETKNLDDSDIQKRMDARAGRLNETDILDIFRENYGRRGCKAVRQMMDEYGLRIVRLAVLRTLEYEVSEPVRYIRAVCEQMREVGM